MDPKDELNEERSRRIRAEEDLAAWQNGAIQKLSPEEIAQVIQTQQLQALTYHLMKQKQAADDAASRLRAKEKELSEAVNNIRRLEEELDSKNKELEKARKDRETRVQPVSQPVGQRFGVSGIPTDEELESILAMPAQQTKAQRVTPGMQRTKRKPKGFKDFIQLLRRMERINLYDAALLLDQNQDDVMLWARALERRGYITIHGLREKTIQATDKMVKTR
ncbi:MAG: hypothetical protein V1875_07980 [Candidatus Altiarchaeota archaeon]